VSQIGRDFYYAIVVGIAVDSEKESKCEIGCIEDIWMRVLYIKNRGIVDGYWIECIGNNDIVVRKIKNSFMRRSYLPNTIWVGDGVAVNEFFVGAVVEVDVLRELCMNIQDAACENQKRDYLFHRSTISDADKDKWEWELVGKAGEIVVKKIVRKGGVL
jgi:hypothetical protein